MASAEKQTERTVYLTRAEFKKKLRSHSKAREKNIRRVLRDFARCEVLPGWWPDRLVPIRTKTTIGLNVFGSFYGSVEWRMLGYSVHWRCHAGDFTSKDLEVRGVIWWGITDYSYPFDHIQKLESALKNIERSSGEP